MAVNFEACLVPDEVWRWELLAFSPIPPVLHLPCIPLSLPPTIPPSLLPPQDGNHRLSREADLQLMCRLLGQLVQQAMESGPL